MKECNCLNILNTEHRNLSTQGFPNTKNKMVLPGAEKNAYVTQHPRGGERKKSTTTTKTLKGKFGLHLVLQTSPASSHCVPSLLWEKPLSILLVSLSHTHARIHTGWLSGRTGKTQNLLFSFVLSSSTKKCPCHVVIMIMKMKMPLKKMQLPKCVSISFFRLEFLSTWFLFLKSRNMSCFPQSLLPIPVSFDNKSRSKACLQQPKEVSNSLTEAFLYLAVTNNRTQNFNPCYNHRLNVLLILIVKTKE